MSAIYILVVNVGSTSAKLQLFEVSQQNTSAQRSSGEIGKPDANRATENSPASMAMGMPAENGNADGRTLRWHKETRFATDSDDNTIKHLIQESLKDLWSNKQPVISGPNAITIVGHRVVHGGTRLTRSVEITPDVQKGIERCEEFAPIHNRLNLAGILACKELFADSCKQVAVFDTAFHHAIPAVAAAYPGPYDWYDTQGIRRYGFHGISNQYALGRTCQLLNMDASDFNGLICHLGGGCSITAVQQGRSVDTTMGFTPLEGVMMGTRSGSIDPGILLHLLRNSGTTVDALEHTLNYESGLKGISGIGNDLQELQKLATSGNTRATLAIDMFIYRLRSYVASMLVHVNNPNLIVFTGGIGEHSSEVRSGALGNMSDSFGIRIDEQLNKDAKGDCIISARGSRIKVLVIACREDLSIVDECLRVSVQSLPLRS